MTFSGEGPSLGERCAFLRLGGCNLACSWCDTAYTWDASRFDLRRELVRRDGTGITDELIGLDTGLVIISGGEPLLQQRYRGWELVLRTLAGAGIRVEVETNGTVAPSRVSREFVSRFTVSPKLAHAGMADDRRIVPEVIGAFRLTGRAVFKFVCATAEDVAETQRWVKTLGLDPGRVWVMPEGTDRQSVCDHLSVIADPAVAAGFNVTTRLHVLAWGNERGR